MKTLLITTAAALTIWGGGANAQSVNGASDLPIVKADFGRRGGKRGRGGRRAMMQVLRAADADGDRSLTQAELDTYNDAQTKAADANGDGDITLVEFETVWKSVTSRRAVRAFQALDADGSGTITAAERTARFGNVVERMDRNDDGKLDRADMRRGRK